MSSSLDGARTLGSYQLLSQLAVGGMAEIYIARTHGVGGFEKMVALKVIHPNFSADPDFVQMLVDEAKLSVQLTHANIVQTFDLGRVDEQYYIAMELIDGVDLYKLLRRASEHEIDFPFEVAAFICAEVAMGLDYAHRKRDARGRPLKIVHRDVSPQNVLVSYDGEVKIVDFGIAKAAMRGQQTAAGVIKGKYYYMSPEQAWGDPIDSRTDIFSAGILLYEMIVGQMLYLEEDLEKLLDVVRKAQISPPSSQRMGVPRELEAVLMRCLKKRADDRYPTAGELAQALQQFTHGFAPDFSRARLAAFMREVMGEDPTSARRDPRTSTAHSPNAAGMVSAIEVRDENSLIFSLRNLADGAGMAEPLAPSKAPPPRQRTRRRRPRRADVATNIGPTRDETGQRLGPAVRAADDFEENEATIVDSKGETLLALVPDGGESDSTRPAGPALRRGSANAPSGRFDLGEGDPAKDADLDAPTVNVPQKRAGQSPVSLDDDDDDMPTGARMLPRSHATRPIESPPDDDLLDEPRRPTSRAPESPPSLPGMVQRRPSGQADAARHSRAPSQRAADGEHAGADRAAAEDTVAAHEPDVGDAALAASGAARDRRRTSRRAHRHAPLERSLRVTAARSSTRRARWPIAATPPPPSLDFGDDGPEPTVSARPQNAGQPPRPPSQKVQPITAPMPSTSAAATITLPPAQNPLGPVHKPSQRLSFEEPTRIPPAQPPPIDSGPLVQSPDGPRRRRSDASSPLAEPAARAPAQPAARRCSTSPSRRPASASVLAILGFIAIAAVAAVMLAGGGELRGTLSIVSLPPGAEVRVDGVGGSQQTPLTLTDVDPRASHHVRVSKSGFDVWESDVKFPPGEREFAVQLVLVPTVGTVEIASTPPGAEAIVNGRIRGMTPTTVGDLPPNDDVVIELRLRGYKVAHKIVSWSGKRLLQLSIPLEKAK